VGGEEVEDALPEDGTELDPEMYGNNTPVVKVSRRRQSLNPTGVWGPREAHQVRPDAQVAQQPGQEADARVRHLLAAADADL